MEVLNYSRLRKNLKKILDLVVNDNETVIINRGDDNAVIISLSEYNSWKETTHLLSTEANRRRIAQAIERDKSGEFISNSLIEE